MGISEDLLLEVYDAQENLTIELGLNHFKTARGINFSQAKQFVYIISAHPYIK